MLSYKLEKFEGPLDLLLHLIEKNKVSIYDIPIFEITNCQRVSCHDSDASGYQVQTSASC